VVPYSLTISSTSGADLGQPVAQGGEDATKREDGRAVRLLAGADAHTVGRVAAPVGIHGGQVGQRRARRLEGLPVQRYRADRGGAEQGRGHSGRGSPRGECLNGRAHRGVRVGRSGVTLQTYSHLWPGDDARMRAVMDAGLGGLADSLRTRGA
jgi:hypothetical protein